MNKKYHEFINFCNLNYLSHQEIIDKAINKFYKKYGYVDEMTDSQLEELLQYMSAKIGEEMEKALKVGA